MTLEEINRLTGPAFDARMEIMRQNLQGRMVEMFCRAGWTTHPTPRDAMNDLTRGLIEVQRSQCRSARISEEQRQDFENRIDNWAADAVLAIEECLVHHPNHQSVEFQLAVARRLGLQVAG
jgi:hypothetical protein